ncbi:MAG: hypothetical protein ABI330_10800 [Caldimonas sp.]
MSMQDIDLAEQLLQEHARNVRFLPFAAAAGVATLEEAYEVQRRYVRLQRVARGTESAGYKIGLTSAGMQAAVPEGAG